MKTQINENDHLSLVKVDGQSFLITKNSIQYTFIVKLKEKSIDFFIKQSLSSYSYEGIFIYDDFLKLNKIFYIFEELKEIYSLIISTFEKNQIDFSIMDNFLNMKLKIDMNVKNYEIILKIPKNPEVNFNQVIDEMSVYLMNMNEKIKNLNPPKFYLDSTILKENEFQMIEDWVGKKIEVKLLYKASIHGDRSADFHNKCDNKGPTICFIETMRGVRFGGFTNINWDQSGTTKNNDPEAFIFSLDHKKKYSNTNHTSVIYCAANNHVTFGGGNGYDFFIVDYIGNTGSYSNFPCCYGKNEKFENRSQTYLTGSYYFVVKELEVYSVISQIKNK